MRITFISDLKKKGLPAKISASVITLLMCSAWVSGRIENNHTQFDPFINAMGSSPISDSVPLIDNHFDQRDPKDEPSIPPFERNILDDLSTQFTRQ